MKFPFFSRIHCKKKFASEKENHPDKTFEEIFSSSYLDSENFFILFSLPNSTVPQSYIDGALSIETQSDCSQLIPSK